MTPEEYRRVCELLEEIVELSEADRETLLARLGREEPDLHREVQSLLGYLDDMSRPDLFEGARIEEFPFSLGHYCIEAQLGAGGMGVVYDAQQEEPRRSVALKIIHPGVASETALRRFQLEALLLARLQHPGIAQIYETGTFDTDDVGTSPEAQRFLGLPYIAMERVRGSPITEFASSLDTPQQLLLFEKVCRSVQYAHSQGVIHRDLKPANILVDGRGEPRLLDFGIARVIEDDSGNSITGTFGGFLLGTMPYMSPEQVSFEGGGVDTRSDLYSLGVILFELLTGELPHDDHRDTPGGDERSPNGPASFEWARPRRGPARRLGSLRAVYRGDLEVICAKALATSPDERYATALDLADDIRSFLNREPIRARPPSTVYRLRKFVSRNRLLATGLTTLLMGVLSGIIGLAWGVVTSHHSLETLKLEKKLTEAAIEETRRESTKTRQMLGFLEDLLLSPSPNQSAGKTLTVREVLDRAAARIDSAFGGDPELKAWAHYRIGKCYMFLGAHAAAEPHAQASARLYSENFGDDHLETLTARNFVSLVYLRTRRHEECRELAEDCLKRGLARHGEGAPETLAAMMNLAGALRKLGDLEQADELDRRILDLNRKYLGESDQKTLSAYHNVALIHYDAKRYAEAEKGLRLAYGKCVEHLGPHHTQTLHTLYTLAKTLDDLERDDEAARTYEQVIVGQRKYAGLHHYETLLTLRNYFLHCYRLGNWEKARELAADLLTVEQERGGADSPQALVALNNLAVIELNLEHNDEALSLLDEFVSRKARLVPAGDLDTASGQLNCARALYNLSRHEEALQRLARSRELAERTAPAGHWILSWLGFHEGRNLVALSREVEAEDLLAHAYEGVRGAFGPEHERTMSCCRELRNLYRRLGKADLADALPCQ